MFDAILHGQVHWLWLPVAAFMGLLAGALCSAARDWYEYHRDYYPSIEEAEEMYERPRRVK